jgi:superfamily I DNA/RNA helicase
MTFFGITQGTASWLLGKAGAIDALHELLLDTGSTLSVLSDKEFVEGPVRLSAIASPSLICAWNVEYNSGLGDDAWGFVVLGTQLGVGGRPDISREVLERCLYIVSQRLQGLLIEGAFIHRSWPNGAHTCLAGRGTEARHVSIAYVERDVADGPTVLHAILCVGPEFDFSKLSAEVVRRAEALTTLLPAARKLYDPSRKKRSLSPEQLPRLRQALAGYVEVTARPSEFAKISIATGDQPISERDSYRTSGWTYRQWIAADSPLSPIQRRILFSDAINRHPVRIMGPGGSGKTLLMQLLALRRLESAAEARQPARVLYLVHNAKMAETVRHRFSVLKGSLENLASAERVLLVSTLTDYGLTELGLAESQVIDPDAYAAKEFQLETLSGALAETITACPKEVRESQLFQEVNRDPELLRVLTHLIMAEISTAIKGHGLTNDERRYVQSERPLSRLHGVLRPDERKVIFMAFQRYHQTIFDGYGVLDSDDVAISLLGKLRTPIWDLRRREAAFDHVFVDEAQLFNENERRVLPYLTKSTTPYVPVVLALDEAQHLYGQTSAGLATLGIENVASESLSSIHRSSKAIIRLAFFVIQRSTDLFGPDFPDFTGLAAGLPEDTSPIAKPPRVEIVPEVPKDYGRSIIRRIRALRKANLWRLAVICMAESYWRPILSEFRQHDLPLHVLEHRGEKLSPTDPVVVLSRPAHIGGQEFDAVILLGAEQGLTPPRVLDNDALAVAVEQQALRELYLAITRARHQVVVALARGATLTPVLADAVRAGLLEMASRAGG